MNDDTTNVSFEIMHTKDFETGLVSYVVRLDDVNKVIDTMDKQGQKLHQEIVTLRAKIEWLSKADKLVVWDGEQWKVRQEHSPEGRR